MNKHIKNILRESVLLPCPVVRGGVIVAFSLAANIMQAPRERFLCFASNLKAARNLTVAVRIGSMDASTIEEGDKFIARVALNIGSLSVPVSVARPSGVEDQVFVITPAKWASRAFWLNGKRS